MSLTFPGSTSCLSGRGEPTGSAVVTRRRLDDAPHRRACVGFPAGGRPQPPRWPDPVQPQQFPLDLGVPDLDRAQEDVLNPGALTA